MTEFTEDTSLLEILQLVSNVMLAKPLKENEHRLVISFCVAEGDFDRFIGYAHGLLLSAVSGEVLYCAFILFKGRDSPCH